MTVIHRRDQFRGDPILAEALAKRENVTLRMNTVVTALLGQEHLTGLALRDTVTGVESELEVAGLFQAVGQQPQTQLAAALGLTGADGFLPAGEDCLTAAPGVFVAGDCRTKEVRQLTTACADGAVAALAACRWSEGR